MQIVIDIDEKDYNDIMFDVETSPRLLNRYEWLIAHGRLLPIVQADILDKIRSEIENRCGLAKENHCKYCPYCTNLIGVREILEIIDKCKAENEVEK